MSEKWRPNMRKIYRFGVIIACSIFLLGCNKGKETTINDNIVNLNTMDETKAEQMIDDTNKTENNVGTTEMIDENNPMAKIKATDVVAEMKVGWSLGNTLDSVNDSIFKADQPYKWETAWHNPKVTEELIDTVIDKGFNVIRIPVSWENHIIDENNYKIVDSWMNRVQEIVDYAYNNGVYIILNTHHENWYEPYYDNFDAAKEKMEAVWNQIAERFKDYDEHLIFEGMNEPRKKGTNVEWTGDNEGFAVVNKLNRVFVDTIRKSAGNNPYRILMIPGYAANGYDGLKKLEVMKDDKVIVSVHAYVPYNFALNTKGTSEWKEDKKDINVIMKTIETKYINNGIPVIVGEFGAMNKENESERINWVTYYLEKAKELGVPCVWWDNGTFDGTGERFGLINRLSYEWQYPELVDAMIELTK